MVKNIKKMVIKIFVYMVVIMMLVALFIFVKYPHKLNNEKPTFVVMFDAGLNGLLDAKIDGENILSGSQIEEGTIIEFIAKPFVNYIVDQWSITGGSLEPSSETDASTNVKVTVSAPITVAVTFKASTMPVTFSVEGKNGILTANVDGKNITTGAKVQKGKTVAFTATPNKNYKVGAWTLDGMVINSNAKTYSLTITKAVEAKVSFLPVAIPVRKFKIVFNNPSNGTLVAKFAHNTTLLSGYEVKKGEMLVFTVNPDMGYEVDCWIVNGVAVSNNKTHIYSHIVSGNATVSIRLAKKTYKVNFETEKGVPVPVEQSLGYGGNALEPSLQPIKEGYTFEGWYNKHNNSPWDFTNDRVIENITLYANWRKNPYAIVFSVSSGEGTLTAKSDDILETDTSSITENEGKIITFTASPKSGYEVEKWVLNGTVIAEAGKNLTYSYIVTENAEVNVSFKVSDTSLAPSVPAVLEDKIYMVDGVSFVMKSIGNVINGRVGHSDENDNAPHNVHLSSYRIGETEVTQALWQAVMSSNPSKFNAASVKTEIQQNRPVEQVNWFECLVFCNELTKKVAELGEIECVYYSDVDCTTVYNKKDSEDRKRPYQNMNKKGFRLPTEAEWEWAAKGGMNDKWAGTNEKDKLKDYAWYSDDGDAENPNAVTHEVKKKQANGYGLYDMSGNVLEWCWDWYSSETPDDKKTDPIGRSLGFYRVLRGGSWNFDADSAACAYRINYDPSLGYSFFGLRLVCRL